MYRVGVDPGVNGCVALVTDNKAILVDVPRHDDGLIDAYSLFHTIKQSHDEIGELPECVNVENVHAVSMTAAGVTFKFGRAAGVMQAVVELVFHGAPFFFPTPPQWKKHYGLLKTEKKASKDHVLKHYVQYAPKRHDQADAILIALYPNK